MKKIIIIIVILLLLGGGGAAGYYFFLMPKDEKPTSEAISQDKTEYQTVRFDALSVPVIRQGRVAKYVTIKIMLEIEPDFPIKLLTDSMPRLRDSSLRTMHDYFASVAIDAPINIRTLKKRLLRAMNMAIGKGVIANILIQGVYEKKN